MRFSTEKPLIATPTCPEGAKGDRKDLPIFNHLGYVEKASLFRQNRVPTERSDERSLCKFSNLRNLSVRSSVPHSKSILECHRVTFS